MSRLLLAIVCPSTCLAQWPSPKTAMKRIQSERREGEA